MEKERGQCPEGTADVSVVIPVYNHKAYVEQAIRSVLMQKVNFRMEVIVAEDCSTDGSREVLKRLEPELTDNWTILYREHNYGPIDNYQDLYSRMQGRYFIVLEGDDYWTYEYKLQKQYEFLETHPDYIAVAHRTQVVDQNGIPTGEKYPECLNEEYTAKDFENYRLPGQTTTLLIRNVSCIRDFQQILDPPDYPGDWKKAFLCLANGKVRCFQEQWSCYRKVKDKGSSFSASPAKYYVCADSDLLEQAAGLKKEGFCLKNAGQRILLRGLVFQKSIFQYAQDYQTDPQLISAAKRMYLWRFLTCCISIRLLPLFKMFIREIKHIILENLI